ncbi:MAG: LysR family transcriptional regulator [Gammaproteobacteria bacterium]|nr:LysR family transcriptional regulator [Gammaproteobacteria bacterium]
MSTFPAGTEINNAGIALEWSDLSVILAICRAGTLSGAARILGHNHSTIFRKIKAIEDKTKVRFFERLPEGYAMTDAGRTAFRYAERIESEFHALGREVLGQDMRLQGKIRVTAPEGFGLRVGPKLFAEFIRRNPEVSIDFFGLTAAVDLNRREADIAIRATAKPPDTSLGRKVCNFNFAFYGTPEYVDRNTCVSISEQRMCLIQGTVDWLVPLLWKKAEEGEALVSFSSTGSFAVLNAAAQGIGCTFMPCYLGDSDDRLVRLCDPIEPMTLELWLLTHPDLRHTARVKTMMSFLHEELVNSEDLFMGKTKETVPGFSLL